MINDKKYDLCESLSEDDIIFNYIYINNIISIFIK